MRKSLLVLATLAVVAGLLCYLLSGAEDSRDTSGPSAPVEGPLERARTSTEDALLASTLKTGNGALTIGGTVTGPDGAIAGATVVAVRVDAEENLADCAR